MAAVTDLYSNSTTVFYDTFWRRAYESTTFYETASPSPHLLYFFSFFLPFLFLTQLVLHFFSLSSHNLMGVEQTGSVGLNHFNPSINSAHPNLTSLPKSTTTSASTNRFQGHSFFGLNAEDWLFVKIKYWYLWPALLKLTSMKLVHGIDESAFVAGFISMKNRHSLYRS